MARLRCLCGHEISNVGHPSDHTGHIVNGWLQDFLDYEPIAPEEILNFARSIWECPKCGRLAVAFPRPWESTVKWYEPTDGVPGNILAHKYEEAK